MDGLELDLCDGLFDHIDDLLDFSNEDIEGDIVGGDCDGLKDVWPAPMDTLAGSSSLFSDVNLNNGTSELPTELSVPCEDIAELEWLSNFVEDSYSAGSINLDEDNKNINNENNDSHQFQTSSPVSVLESSSSCSGGKINLYPETVVRGRARSKRPRPATFNPRPMIPLISPSSSITEPPSPPFSPSELLSDFENFAESYPESKIRKTVKTEQKMKTKMKMNKKKWSSHSGSLEQSAPSHPMMMVRKCMHCEITKTPQWRAGPMGPKTLCNACGVRYKSGRLFPEYRPAASPTFVESLHSNSHKKVLEMRNQVGQKMGAAATLLKPTPDFMRTSSHLL